MYYYSFSGPGFQDYTKFLLLTPLHRRELRRCLAPEPRSGAKSPPEGHVLNNSGDMSGQISSIGRTMRAVQTLKQRPAAASFFAAQTRWQGDHIYRDVIAPFGCQKSYYTSSCRFSNTVRAYGVEPTPITALENGRPGFRLSCSGTREYEILLEGGWVKLGLLNTPRTTKTLLAEGSASSEATWKQFTEIVRQREGR